MTIEEKIAKQIKEARAEKGLTQFQLSEVSGVNRSQLAKIECATSSVSVGVLERILKPLGYEVCITKKQILLNEKEKEDFEICRVFRIERKY